MRETDSDEGDLVPYKGKKRKKTLLGLDDVAGVIAGLGIPGLVLLVTMSVVGFAGAAALTAALAALGGPLGMLGGIGVLGVLVVISRGLTQYGLAALYKSVVIKLYAKGVTKEQILEQIQTYPISQALKRKLKEIIEEQPD